MGLVVASVWFMSNSEVDWLYRGGVGQLFPAEWEKFWNGIPPEVRTEDVVADYVKLMDRPNAAVRGQAAIDWTAWEDAVLSLEPNGKRHPYSDKSTDAIVAFVRICSTFALHNAWREDGSLIDGAHLLNAVPGSIIHGRLDLSCPLKNAWDLARAWPKANLVIVEDAGHKGSPNMNLALREAFALLA